MTREEVLRFHNSAWGLGLDRPGPNWEASTHNLLVESGDGRTGRGSIKEKCFTCRFTRVRRHCCCCSPSFFNKECELCEGLCCSLRHSVRACEVGAFDGAALLITFVITFRVAGSDVSLMVGIDSWLSVYPTSTPAFVLDGLPFLHSIVLQKYKNIHSLNLLASSGSVGNG